MSGGIALVPDCGRGVGLGHLERMLALAHALGTTSCVVVPPDDEVVRRVIARGVRWMQISGDLPRRTLEAASLAGVVVVDAYTLGLATASAAMSRTALVIVDDLGHTWPCDLMINPSAGGDGRLNPYAHRAVGGAAYALLRVEYLEARARRIARPVASRARRILVTSGGLALDGIGLRLSAELVSRIPGVDITLVAGPEADLGTPPADDAIRVVVAPAHLADLLEMADLCVCTAGTTALQAACVGVPAIVLAVVANQTDQAVALAESRCAVRALDVASAASQAAALVDAADTRCRMAERGRALIDGAGCRRAAALVDGLLAPASVP